ncbi:MAG: hypothetical protein HY257_09625 [Chloroflexi bacterium]|nr:hypothetical protein [Chloroflexota bacterium]
MAKQKSLWKINSCDEWQAAWDRYSAIVRAQNVNGLAELDDWHRAELPRVLASRAPAYITRAELERVTVWKMKRGVWRERNRLLVIGNDAAKVKTLSTKAFAAIPDPRKPVDLLSELAGVGPATASGVLAAYAPAMYPFFDELVAQQIPNLGKVAFTATYYQRYAAALRERAQTLSRACAPREWNAHAVSQALWSHSGGKAAQ